MRQKHEEIIEVVDSQMADITGLGVDEIMEMILQDEKRLLFILNDAISLKNKELHRLKLQR